MDRRDGPLDSTPSAPMPGEDQANPMMSQPYMAQRHPSMPQPYFQGQDSDDPQEKLPPPYSESEPPSIPQSFMQFRPQATPNPQPQVIHATQNFTSYNQQVVCPTCRTTVTTNILQKPGLMSWLGAGLCCVFGGWLGCYLIPFYIDSCQDVEHYCPNCRNLLDLYQRL